MLALILHSLLRKHLYEIALPPFGEVVPGLVLLLPLLPLRFQPFDDDDNE